MKNMKFVFAVSFCAMFAASAALASAPNLDNSDMGTPHTVFTDLAPTDENGAGAGIAGVTYVNRAVNSAGAAAIAAEAHAAAAGAYAVSAKTSADNAAAAAGNAQTAADEAKTAANNANSALAGKADKSEIPTVNNATLTIQRNGTTVGTFTANAGSNETVNIVDNDTIYTLPTASDEVLGGVKVGANLSIDGDGVLSAKDTTYTAGDNITISDDGTISATDTVYTLPKASDEVLGGVKVGANLSIDGDGVLSAKDTTYTAGTNITITDGVISATGTNYTAGDNITITDGKISATVPTGALASLNTVGSSEITDNAVTTAKILDGEVKTADIADSAVTTPKIADSAVTTAKIADGAVTAIKTTGIIGKVPSGSEDSTTLASIWLQ